MPETRATILTGQGRGAVAVVRVWGRDAVNLVDQSFRPGSGRPLAKSRPGSLRVGRIGAGLGDEVVVVTTTDTPPQVEIQCHGGCAATQLVLDDLVRQGVMVATPEEWVGRNTTKYAAQAWHDLAKAPTLRSAQILLDQAKGALDQAFEMISSLEDISRLIESSKVGLRLLEGWRIVLAGRPNVGKSRLLNALAGYNRAIVHSSPGTTRDIVTLRTAFDGWPVEIADTAGLRETYDAIEAEGVNKARVWQADADLVLLLLDLSQDLTDDDRKLMQEYRSSLRVATKSDLPARWSALDLNAVPLSAERGYGLDALIAKCVYMIAPDMPTHGGAVIFRSEQIDDLNVIRSRYQHEVTIRTDLELG